MLKIHEISARPAEAGLGAVLMHAAAIQAEMLGCGRIRTTATAQNVFKFYLDMGLHPEPAPEVWKSALPPLAIPPSSSRADQKDFTLRLMFGRLMSANPMRKRKETAHLAGRTFEKAPLFERFYMP